ncbi:tetratricopeptide repeat protein [Nitrosopumilus ureiphilus]|uniref:Uncharacterized protein n=1 Tax=Nitrosopumilus ureiphilus TaxID=1470067 RepID=A0A7D5M8A3_9ARCH|nr:tetratricopeptide repeat protein [Nitrosopumilus ureiphilus]QLH06930.1 hypothetical protein C5F50_07485 [Nitrosopumilus ureiphilus]
MPLKEIRVQFNVPFQIDLPDNPYSVKNSKYSCMVYLAKKISKDNASGWYGNPRISEDRFGHTNYSRCVTRFVFSNPVEFEEEKIQKICTKYSLDALNKILNTCRWKSNEFFNHDILRKDVVAIKYRYFDENHNELGGWTFSSKGAIKIGGKSNLSDAEIGSIKESLMNEKSFPFVSELAKNSIDYFGFRNFRLACVEIQTSAEIILSDILRTYLNDLNSTDPSSVQAYLDAANVNNPSISEFPRYRWDVIKPVLRAATFDTITGESTCQNWNNKCKETRHRVVHAGHQPDQQETIDALKSGLDFLNLLKNYKTTDYDYSNENFDSNIIDKLIDDEEIDEEFAKTLSFEEIQKIDESKVEEFLKKAQEYIKNRKVNDAIKIFDDTLVLDPLNFQVLGNKGIILENEKKYEDAVKCFEEILLFENEHQMALLHKATSLIQLDINKAIQTFDELIKLKPDHLQALGRKGDALCRLQKYDEALCCFDSVLKYNSNIPEAYFKKSLIKYIQGNTSESMELLKNSIEKDVNYKEKAKKAKTFSALLENEEFKKITG